MSRKYKFKNPAGVYFVSFSVVNWVDALTRSEYKDILVKNLAFCQQNKGLDIFAWCVPDSYRESSHVHLIVRAQEGYALEGILRDYKKFTSKEIIRVIKENPVESRREWLLEQFKTKDGFTFWQGDNHPIELWSNEVIDQKLNYLHQNPVDEGLVFRAEDYRYSSACDYAGENGMLDILVIETWYGQKY